MKLKILELYGSNNQATGARYLASETDGQTTVQSEGNWYFDPVSLASATEESIATIIREATTKDGINSIQARLNEQLASQSQPVRPPWVPETFTVSV